jgi:hypothetical protein
MPFLMETDEAVNQIGEAIMRGQAAIAFPWQMALVSRVLRLLPNGVFDIAAKRM